MLLKLETNTCLASKYIKETLKITKLKLLKIL